MNEKKNSRGKENSRKPLTLKVRENVLKKKKQHGRDEGRRPNDSSCQGKPNKHRERNETGLWPFEEPKTKKSVFQSEPEVLPCFETNYKFLERYKKPLSFTTTRK